MKAKIIYFDYKDPSFEYLNTEIRVAVKTRYGLCIIKDAILLSMNTPPIKADTYSKLSEFYLEVDSLLDKGAGDWEDFGERILSWRFAEPKGSIVGIYSFGRLENGK